MINHNMFRNSSNSDFLPAGSRHKSYSNSESSSRSAPEKRKTRQLSAGSVASGMSRFSQSPGIPRKVFEQTNNLQEQKPKPIFRFRIPPTCWLLALLWRKSIREGQVEGQGDTALADSSNHWQDFKRSIKNFFLVNWIIYRCIQIFWC